MFIPRTLLHPSIVCMKKWVSGEESYYVLCICKCQGQRMDYIIHKL